MILNRPKIIGFIITHFFPVLILGSGSRSNGTVRSPEVSRFQTCGAARPVWAEERVVS